MVIFCFSNAVYKHVDDDFNVQHDHHRHHTLACLRFLTPAAAGMDGHLYTGLLVEIMQKLQNSWSTPNRTSPRGPGAANVPAVRACAAVLPNLTRCPAVPAALPSNGPSTATNPTWLPSCAAPERRNERFALFSRSHHAALLSK